MLPEKLQIVKPIEGSQTLQHWQYLATPNLGCLFESRPGISIKGSHQSQNGSPTSKKTPACDHGSNEVDDGMYEGDDFDYDEFDYENDHDDYDETDFMHEGHPLPPSQPPPNLRSDSFYSDVNNNNLAYNNHNRRMLSPSKMELLTKLLENEERHQREPEADVDESADPAAGSSIFGFIRSISTRYFRSTSTDEPASSSSTSTSTTTTKKTRHEYDDPDTPPSSPINLPRNQNSDKQSANQNILLDVFKSAKSYFNRSKSTSTVAPTPPGTPTHELEHPELDPPEPINQPAVESTSFFDQIVNKLNVFSSFRAVQSSLSNDALSGSSVKRRPSRIVKPTAVYAVGETKKQLTQPELRVSDFDQDERELVELASSAGDAKLCNTPPPSPSKFSPPPPELEADYSEEQIKKSAFVKVASLNPYLNQSSVDLASLLGTLSSLKRSQRLCK